MVDTAAPPDVKQLSAHMAMHADLSHGFAGCGQQSMSSMAAVSESAIAAISDDITVDFTTAAAPPAAGKTATDRAISNANMVRAAFMTHGKIADCALPGS